MRPVSQRLLSTIRGSHGMAARARVVSEWQVGTNPTGVEIPILGGDVQLDASADIRSTVDLVTDPKQWPHRATDLLTPYGNELFIERGVKLGGGVTEWVSLGYFRIDVVTQSDAPKGAVRILGRDRMAGIVDGRLTAPRQFQAVATYGSVVNALVADIYPAATVEWDDSTNTRPLGRAVVAEDDRHRFLADLVTSVGKVMFWDHRGVLVIRTPPDPAQPVFAVNAGEGGVLVSLAREVSREGVYNGWVVTGEATDTQIPARAVVVDSNPSSPTRWGGRFGKIPGFHSSPLITTNTQAYAAGTSLLRTSIGLPYSVDFSAVPNPALEPLDPVRVADPGIGTRIHVLDKLTIPLLADQPMMSQTREQAFVPLGSF